MLTAMSLDAVQGRVIGSLVEKHLTTPQQCGLPTDCIDVGNATVGMCKYP